MGIPVDKTGSPESPHIKLNIFFFKGEMTKKKIDNKLFKNNVNFLKNIHQIKDHKNFKTNTINTIKPIEI